MPFPETSIVDNIFVHTVVATFLMYAGMTGIAYLVLKQVRHFFR